MITKKQFSTFEDLFNYYNSNLFDGELPEVMINMSRKKRSHGFFAPERWATMDGQTKVHEISLNPDSLHRPAAAWHSTLVHEMCHLWRQCNAKGTVGYHDKIWGSKMESIGLMPSSTGEPGGKRTGQKMTHYIIDDGPFDQAFKVIQGEDFSDLTLPYLPLVHETIITKKGTPTVSGKRVKYECSCGQKVWGKADMLMICGLCEEKFEPVK
jgi:predicted SprT family Zn-dependent metalloprotease